MNTLLSYLGLIWLRIIGSGSEVAPVSESQPESTWATPLPVDIPSGIQTPDTGTESTLIPNNGGYPSIQDKLSTSSDDSTNDSEMTNNDATEPETKDEQNESADGQPENELPEKQPPETPQSESPQSNNDSDADELSTGLQAEPNSNITESSEVPQDIQDSTASSQQPKENETTLSASQVSENTSATNSTINGTADGSKKVDAPTIVVIEKEVDEIKEILIKDYQIAAKIFVLVALVLLVVGYSIAIVFYTNKYLWNEIKSAILNGYHEFVEKQVPSKKLLPSQIIYLGNFTWKSQNGGSLDCIQSETNFEGQIFKIEYKDKESQLFFSPMAIRENELKKQMVFYYEVEISYIYDQAKLVIGFMELESQEQTMPKISPGKFANSIGFNIKTGEIYHNNEVAHTFKYQEIIEEMTDLNQSGMVDLTGCFFGIGINYYLKKFFFTFNGTVLNTLSYQAMTEIRYKDFDMRRKDLISETEGIRGKENMNQYTRKLQIKKEFRDEIKGLKDFKCNIKNLAPVIFMERLCRISLNVGGSPFQLRDRELKHGLLLGE